MGKLREQMTSAMAARGYSPHSQRIYLNAVTQLAEYYHRSPDLVTESEIEKFLIYLAAEKNLSRSTINTYVHGLRFFFNMVSNGKHKLTVTIPTTRPDSKIPEILSPKEVQKILAHTTSLRYRTIFMLAYGAGLRASEITYLTVDDIDSQRMVLHIRVAKGNRHRYALLTPALLEALRTYWRRYRPLYYLFPSRRNHGEPVGANMVSRVFRNIKKELKINKKGGVHSLRHSFATHLLESGVDVFQLQQLLGHQRVSSTTHYLRTSSTYLKTIESPLDLVLSNKQLP